MSEIEDNFNIDDNDNELEEHAYSDGFEELNQKRRNKERKLERKAKKAQKRVELFTFFLRIIIICILIAAPVYMARLKYWKLNPHAFDSLKNTSIKIENNYIVPSDKILKAVQKNKVPACPIFLMKTNDIKESIMKLTPIQDVYIKRFWFPARIEIIVNEKEPAITIAPNENVPPIAFYMKDGSLISRNYLPLNPMFKTVKVLTYGSYNGNSKFTKEKIKFFTNIAKDVEYASDEPVLYIDYRNPDDIYVQIKTVKIKLGYVAPETYADTLKKINYLPSVLPKIKAQKKKIQYVDLRWQNNLFFIKLANPEKDGK